jgi:phosphoserine phosphatase RsbU/P
MIGDVSSHGFPAALIMALSLSAATIYASEVEAPDRGPPGMAEALRDELETTEMYLTLFYGVLDPERASWSTPMPGIPMPSWSGEGEATRLPALDPPMGIADPAGYHARRIPWHVRGGPPPPLHRRALRHAEPGLPVISGERSVVATAARLREAPARDIVTRSSRLERPGIPAEGDDRTAVVLRL